MVTTGSYIFTSESVSEGHPDKVCDYIADSILDTALTADPRSHVACEVMAKSNIVVLGGEITSNAILDYASIACSTMTKPTSWSTTWSTTLPNLNGNPSAFRPLTGKLTCHVSGGAIRQARKSPKILGRREANS